jgi:hypothetical protein
MRIPAVSAVTAEVAETAGAPSQRRRDYPDHDHEGLLVLSRHKPFTTLKPFMIMLPPGTGGVYQASHGPHR